MIYGFFHGDLAGPSIRSRAYTGLNVQSGIAANAREFVNSLRGVSDRFGPVEISPLYAEARGAYFGSWPDDLADHLLRYADATVRPIVQNADDFRIAKREDRVADLMGGMRGPINQPIQSATRGGMMPFQRMTLMREYRQKELMLFEQTKRRGGKAVIIDEEDDDSEGEDGRDTETP